MDNTEAALLARLGPTIRQARQDARLTQVQLAGALGVEQTRLSRWELSKSTPGLLDVVRIEDALELRRGDLLIRAGLVELPVLDAERAIEADPVIADESRSVLLHYYRASVEVASGPGRSGRRRNRGRPKPDNSGPG